MADLYFRPFNVFGLTTIALIVLHAFQSLAFRLTSIWYPYVQNSNTSSSHSEHLSQYLPQTTRSTGDDYNFIIPVELPGQAIRQSLINCTEDGEERDECRPSACCDEIRGIVWSGDRA